jgi:hypothetical protein
MVIVVKSPFSESRYGRGSCQMSTSDKARLPHLPIKLGVASTVKSRRKYMLQELTLQLHKILAPACGRAALD